MNNRKIDAIILAVVTQIFIIVSALFLQCLMVLFSTQIEILAMIWIGWIVAIITFFVIMLYYIITDSKS